jgi:hypothetical protein
MSCVAELTLRDWSLLLLADGVSPLGVMAWCHDYLRGCDKPSWANELWLDDARQWIRRRGMPTRESLLAWLDEVELEADLAGAVVPQNLQRWHDERGRVGRG